MKLNSYLMFDGQCEAAFKFYEKCLGGKIESASTYEGSPMAKHVPPDWGKKIMHMAMTIEDQVLMGADSARGQYEKPQGFSLAIGMKDVSKAEQIFRALSENATVQMPMQETFWATRFGMLTDQFGIPWMINCEKAI